MSGLRILVPVKRVIDYAVSQLITHHTILQDEDAVIVLDMWEDGLQKINNY
jgi:hypothetical protein